jgi:hypothetical protein
LSVAAALTSKSRMMLSWRGRADEIGDQLGLVPRPAPPPPPSGRPLAFEGCAAGTSCPAPPGWQRRHRHCQPAAAAAAAAAARVGGVDEAPPPDASSPASVEAAPAHRWAVDRGAGPTVSSGRPASSAAAGMSRSTSTGSGARSVAAFAPTAPTLPTPKASPSCSQLSGTDLPEPRGAAAARTEPGPDCWWAVRRHLRLVRSASWRTTVCGSGFQASILPAARSRQPTFLLEQSLAFVSGLSRSPPPHPTGWRSDSDPRATTTHSRVTPGPPVPMLSWRSSLPGQSQPCPLPPAIPRRSQPPAAQVNQVNKVT